MPDNINDTYMTASDGTQYFSVLETSNELNNTLIESNYDETIVNTDKDQVVLFKIDDSDDLYGVQVVQDTEGNLQKYQFKVRYAFILFQKSKNLYYFLNFYVTLLYFRYNDEGNLEAVPETFKFLPLDSDVLPQECLEENIDDSHDNNPQHDLVKEELLSENVLPMNFQSSDSYDINEQIENKTG